MNDGKKVLTSFDFMKMGEEGKRAVYNPKPRPLDKGSDREMIDTIKLRAADQNRTKCHWRVAPTDRPERGGVIWSSECRHKFELLDGRPSDYEMRWCPFCGGELVHDRLAGMED